MALFRNEVLKQQKNCQFGDVIISQPTNYTTIFYIVLSFALTAIAFVSAASYTQKQTVQGQITATEGESRFVASQDMFVQSINVENGQVVAAGTVLAQLVKREFDANKQNINDEIADQLALQLALHLDQQHQLKEELKSNKYNLVLQQQSMTKKSLRLTEQLRLTQQRLKIRELQNIKYRDLAEQGLVSKIMANDSQEKLLNEQLQVNSLYQQLEQVDSEIMRVDTEIVALTASNQQQMSRLNRHVSELNQQIAMQKQQSEQTIVAQHDGIISAIRVKAGQNINRGQFLFVLTPLNPTFYAELTIPSRAVAFVQPGTEASLKLNAFPFEKFGALKANVTQISKTPLPVDKTLSANRAESMYQVIAQLSAQHIKAYGVDRPLQDGMVVMADLHIERRSLLEWLIEPLFAAVGQ